MTPDERQALREKHKLADYDIEFCDFCEYRLNGETYPVEYPCDVIKVLDAWERFDKAMIELNEISKEIGIPE